MRCSTTRSHWNANSPLLLQRSHPRRRPRMTDTERLDWLQNTNSARVNIDFKETSLEWWARNDREYHKMCCLTLREAIDAAMNAAGKVRRNTNEDKASTDKTL